MRSTSLKLIYISFYAVVLSYGVMPSAYAADKVAIIMPEVSAVYKVIFDEIHLGITENLNADSVSFVIDKQVESSTVNNWINNTGIDSIIALGPTAYRSVTQIGIQMPVVAGAIMTASGHSQHTLKVALSPEPAEFFDQLTQLDDSIRRVAVVYNPARHQWLVDLAREKAAIFGLHLSAFPAANIKESVNIYDQLLEDEHPRSLAIWLLQDRSIVDSKIVLPFILERSWQRSIMVFSSSLGHVKKGVLFCMYPDNRAHGKQLAQIINNFPKYMSSSHKIPLPTKNSLMAINSRTAAHLGLKLKKSDYNKADVVFPLTN